jgi:hypothetical protein
MSSASFMDDVEMAHDEVGQHSALSNINALLEVILTSTGIRRSHVGECTYECKHIFPPS